VLTSGHNLKWHSDKDLKSRGFLIVSPKCFVRIKATVSILPGPNGANAAQSSHVPPAVHYSQDSHAVTQ
jgi:hypothetical protein